MMPALWQDLASGLVAAITENDLVPSQAIQAADDLQQRVSDDDIIGCLSGPLHDIAEYARNLGKDARRLRDQIQQQPDISSSQHKKQKLELDQQRVAVQTASASLWSGIVRILQACTDSSFIKGLNTDIAADMIDVLTDFIDSGKPGSHHYGTMAAAFDAVTEIWMAWVHNKPRGICAEDRKMYGKFALDRLDSNGNEALNVSVI
jgi:hypothetical protein